MKMLNVLMLNFPTTSILLFLLYVGMGYCLVMIFRREHRKGAFHSLDSIRSKILMRSAALLTTLQRYLLMARDAIDRRIKTGENDGMESLSPTNRAENIAEYERQLKRCMDNPDIANIAVTGTYGSGKSSIIRTFFHKNPQYKTLSVSLANFGVLRTEEPTAEELAKLIEQVELSILQQILYSVGYKNVPFSRFKRIRPISGGTVIFWTILLMPVAYGILYCWQKAWEPFKMLLDGQFTNLTNRDWFAALAVGFGIVLAIRYSVRLLRLGIVKLNLQGAEISVDANKELSILNQFLDELIYFFSTNKFNALIFEDLDRFENTGIFVKLREINSIINNSRQVRGRVAFIYALKDEIFVDERERTKFFDYLIPVVPVTNAANSASILINVFSSIKDHGIATDLLEDLSLFITDRRLIRNICNEFLTYRRQLNNPKLSDSILLSMIVFKNMYPEEFSKLQNNSGDVYQLLKNKSKLIAPIIEKHIEKEQEYLSRLSALDREHRSSLNELRLSYIAKLAEAFHSTGHDFPPLIDIGQVRIPVAQLTSDAFFDLLKANKTLVAHTRYYGGQMVKYNFHQIETEVDPDKTYAEKVETLKWALDFNRIQLQSKLQETRLEIETLRDCSFAELFKIIKITELESSIPNMRVVMYFLEEGYLTEDYYFYLSYFEPGQYTENDMQFILGVKYRHDLDWAHRLNNLSQVYARLREPELSSHRALNYDLTEYLINFQEDEQKAQGHFRLLGAASTRLIPFLEGFRIRKPEAFPRLVGTIASINGSFWHKIQQQLPDRFVQTEYALAIVNWVQKDTLLGQGAHVELVQHIENDPSFLDPDRINELSDYLDLLENLSVAFRVTPKDPIESRLLMTQIADRRLYALEPQMVDAVIKSFDESVDVEQFRKGQLSNLGIPRFNSVKEYIYANMETYLNGVYLELEAHENEKVEVILEILRQSLPDALKADVLRVTPITIDVLDYQDQALFDAIIENERVSPSWENVGRYLRKTDGGQLQAVTPELGAWLASKDTYEALGRDKISSLDGLADNNRERGFFAVLNGAYVSEFTRLALVEAMEAKITHLDFSNLSVPVLRKLLPVLQANTTHFASLLALDFDLFWEFAKQNWQEFEKSFEPLSIDLQQYAKMLAKSTEGSQRTFLLSHINSTRLTAALVQGVRVPKEVFSRDTTKLDDSHISQLNGNLHQELIRWIIAVNAATLSEGAIRSLLEKQGGDYKKLAEGTLQRVAVNQDLLEMLNSLKDQGKIIESITVGPKWATLNYPPSQK